MRLVEFTDHEGQSIWVNVERVLWARPHVCQRDRDDLGEQHVDLCLVGGQYVAVRAQLGDVAATIRAIEE